MLIPCAAAPVSCNPAVTGDDGPRGLHTGNACFAGGRESEYKGLRHALLVYMPESFRNPG